MNYLSVCSGIEAATVAWQDLGWNPVGFSEIEKFPSEVLTHHYPDIPNFGDMTKYKDWNINGTVGLLVGGTPCQSFSVAGLRKGLKDPRGNLALTYCGILDHFRPKWFVWENVPGVLSSNKGRDFGSFLGALVELGYGFSYRVLDAQYFGVAQRRRRVFVVGHLGNWQPTAKVLFESDCLRRDIKTSREKGKEIARGFIPRVANTIQTTCNDYSRADGFNMICYENHGTDSRIKPVKISPTVTARWGTEGNNTPLTHTYSLQGAGATSQNANGSGFKEEQSYTLNVTDVHGVANNMAVRRLTPVECERLQGFPDNYTNIKEKCPDGPRYKALGNSMAVPVMRWIGQRIDMIEKDLL